MDPACNLTLSVSPTPHERVREVGDKKLPLAEGKQSSEHLREALNSGEKKANIKTPMGRKKK